MNFIEKPKGGEAHDYTNKSAACKDEGEDSLATLTFERMAEQTRNFPFSPPLAYEPGKS
jgi:hypothetical protein